MKLKQTVEQVEDAVAMLHGDEEAQLEMLESMLDSYPEGHPISEAAYLVGEKMGLL